MVWFWYFFVYSFFGFLLEVAFARCTGGHPSRKCLLVLPLCPVYGLGACAIILAGEVTHSAPALFLLGAVLSTAVEYAMAVFYDTVLGVSFWDYHHLPLHIQGRVCLFFSLAWGLLTLPLVWWIHPVIAPLPAALPNTLSLCVLFTFLCDLLVSSVLLKHTGDRDSLNWYQQQA